MASADVTLTDYGLALVCAMLTILLWSRGTQPGGLRTWFVVFFGSTGAAAFLGGTFHGFFPDEHTREGALLWRVTLVAIGLAATAAWQVGASVVLSRRAARRLSIVAILELLAYSALVIFVTQSFWIAIVDYLPASLFLLGAFTVAYRRTRARPMLLGIAGLVLTVIASGVQQARIAVHPVYFDHNALYHLIQAAALVLVFRAARAMCREAAA
jgi:hypothetical protein